MRTPMRLVAAVELALIAPAALFLTAVLVGVGDPPQHDLAIAAHRIVGWYRGGVALWLLLVTLPLAALVLGTVALLGGWGTRVPADHPHVSLASLFEPFATLLVGWATITAGAILGVVALHMLAN